MGCMTPTNEIEKELVQERMQIEIVEPGCVIQW
jgi:hypothetical protein